MAKLNSTNKQDFFEIKIINFEHEGEDWAISQILFSHKREDLLSSIGLYFGTLELKGLMLNVKKLLERKENSVDSSFLEPNLEIKINYVENEKYTIAVLFRKFIDYESGKIKDSNESTKKLHFITNHSNLTSFIEALESELKNLENSSTSGVE